MLGLRPLLLAAVAFAVLPSRMARAGFDEFLAKPEPSYHWEKKGESDVSDCKVYELAMVSQEWQGKPWEHRLFLIRPPKLDHPETCLLYNTGGRGGKEELELGANLAKATGCPFAVLFGIPNQPLWGKSEDALVAYTWLQYIESFKKDGKGDDTWPLHFPMAKSVIKSMDALQAFAKESSMPSIDGFIVAGASKRGWTTWLVGASKDPRVKAIVPMVIDTLHVAKQGPHQIASYGKPSEQVEDYTSAGLLQLLATPAGQKLLDLEDPWSYRDRLTMPKLIINGTNDRYWTQDALNIYWDDLPGDKWVIYAPNSGHKLEDRDRVLATLSAFVRTIASGKKLPRLAWKYGPRDGGGVVLGLESDVPMEEGRLFTAESSTLDFRNAHWRFEIMSGKGKALQDDVPAPTTGNVAVFGEAVYSIDGARFTLSSQIRILQAPVKKRWL
jgi:PhoPQ-activated pathogenicity-related protein